MAEKTEIILEGDVVNQLKEMIVTFRETIQNMMIERDEARDKVGNLETRWKVLKEAVTGQINACHNGSWTAYNIKKRMEELEKKGP